MVPIADKYLIVHSVCVKSLHETNVQTSWPFESGNNRCKEAEITVFLYIPQYFHFLTPLIFSELKHTVLLFWLQHFAIKPSTRGIVEI